MNILKNEAAMQVIEDSAEKLRALGLTCMVCPTGLGDYGMTVVIHVAENEQAAAAAVVATRDGSISPHLFDDEERKQFDMKVADFIADASAFSADRTTASKEEIGRVKELFQLIKTDKSELIQVDEYPKTKTAISAGFYDEINQLISK